MRGEMDGDDELDRDAGRRALVAFEALGEALAACEDVPTPLRAQVAALARGRSHVPADGERIDFVAKVRAGLRPVAARGPGGDARALRPWLGGALTAWLAAELEASPVTALGLCLRGVVAGCVEAREALRARHAGAAEAYVAWNAAGMGDEARAAFAAASAVALDEACDRWCALGCEGSLGRYVGTWQRSSAGWAEAHLGARTEVPAGDLGLLRAMQTHVAELQARRAPRRSLPGALARRMGVTEGEAARLLAVHDEVSARRSPEAVLRRRWEVLRPIARAAEALERELGREPAVREIAARAEVHPCLVELALEALEAT